MKINKRQKLIVPFFKVKSGKVVQDNQGGVFMKLAEECEFGNAVDLDTGYLTKIDNGSPVEILDAFLEIK